MKMDMLESFGLVLTEFEKRKGEKKRENVNTKSYFHWHQVLKNLQQLSSQRLRYGIPFSVVM